MLFFPRILLLLCLAIVMRKEKTAAISTAPTAIGLISTSVVWSYGAPIGGLLIGIHFPCPAKLDELSGADQFRSWNTPPTRSILIRFLAFAISFRISFNSGALPGRMKEPPVES